MLWLALVGGVIGLLLTWRVLRVYGIFVKKRSKKDPNSVLVVLGSGGHTMEILKLMNSVCQRFSRRIYVTADDFSKQKAVTYESGYGNEKPEIIFTTRSRNIGQSIVSATPQIAASLFEAFHIVLTNRPHLVLCNGPGTCVPICIAAFVLDLFRFIDCKIVYVESVCRVKTLSLSGKLLYHSRLCNGFLVQWPELKQTFQRAEFIGRLS